MNSHIVKQLYDKMYANRLMRNQEEIDAFRECFQKLKYFKSDLVLADLFLLLNSRGHFPSLQLVLDYIFSFSPKEIVDALVQATPVY